jgi:hypothetical protein
VSKPDEITIHIEPDGRIVVDGREMDEVSYRRLVELLEETIGPARELNAGPGEPPPAARLTAKKDREKRKAKEQKLGRE